MYLRQNASITENAQLRVISSTCQQNLAKKNDIHVLYKKFQVF